MCFCTILNVTCEQFRPGLTNDLTRKVDDVERFVHEKVSYVDTAIEQLQIMLDMIKSKVDALEKQDTTASPTVQQDRIPVLTSSIENWPR